MELGSCGGSAALLEALTAEDRPALCGLERDRGFLAASRATSARFYLVVGGRCAAARGYAQRALALGFAGLAALGFVLELLVVEEELFAGREDEVRPAVNAL